MGIFDGFKRGDRFGEKPQGEPVRAGRMDAEAPPAAGGEEPRHAFSGTITRSSTNMLIFAPQSYDDVQTIIDHLKTGESVILNLKDVPRTNAQRILDFISGAIYAVSGSIYPIEDGLFALTPDGVNIMTKHK